MKIVIDNYKFDFNLGCRILKLKYANCPFEQLSDIWNEIKPITFAEISGIKNLEERRVAFNSFGIDRLISEVNPTLISKETLNKTTTWVTEQGKLETVNYEDTYELFSVESETLSAGLNSWNRVPACHFVRCKDTSTDRQYLIWVDVASVYRTNNPKSWFSNENSTVSALEAIAWTIQTDVPKGEISEIVRQGDCIMILPTGEYTPLSTPRHLTVEEYKTLLVAES